MKTYVILLRGINVGGKNKISMAELKSFLDELGFENVSTYIQSGNVILQSKLDAKAITEKIEKALPTKFKFDSPLIRILTLTTAQLEDTIKNRPTGFGDHPETYHSDAIFLIDIETEAAMAVFSPREGVDRVWPGKGVIYSQRLSAERTKSRLGRIVGTPVYKAMTIRSWSTTTKLWELLKKIDR
jgi:uncharacterized protein (DUF1697 family)